MLLLLSEQAVFLAPEHSMVLISHIFFFHSFSPAWAGMINGALWTMGVLMQFYLLSYFIYKLQKKNALFPIALCLLSVGIKYVVYHYILPYSGNVDPWLYFIYGRQIYSALDNFIIGMIYAQSVKKASRSLHSLIIILTSAAAILYLWAAIGFRQKIYMDNGISYTWHFICAIICGAIIYAAYLLPVLKYPVYTIKFLSQMAKYNYGIYLWHLPITNSVLKYSVWAKNLPYGFIVILLTAFSFVAGYISTKANSFALHDGSINTPKNRKGNCSVDKIRTDPEG